MIRQPRLRALTCALLIAACGSFGATAWAQKAGETVRPEVGKPLQAAQALVKQRKGREALAEISKAEQVPNRTPYENFVIAQMRAAAASAAGDADATIRANEALLSSGRVSGREAVPLVQAIAVAHYNRKEYAEAAKWTNRYFKEGGGDAAMKTMLLQSYFLANDCAAVSKMVGNDESSRRPAEEELQMLANCYQKQRDTGGYVNAIERLVVHYPRKDYWNDLLARVQKKPGFSDRLGVNIYRLRLATGNVTTAADYMEMAQLAMQAGTPAEARIVLDKGYAAGLLGKGDQAERQERLKNLITKTLDESQKNRANDEKDALAAKDGDPLVKVGLNYVYEGKPEKGFPLIEQGIKKGGLRRPEDAKLRLGEAQLHAGQKQRGVQTLREVKSTDGASDIARLWVLHARG